MIVTFAVGNSDDKLTQARWAQFSYDCITLVDQVLENHDASLHFAGHSHPASPWQNALWAVELGTDAEAARRFLRAELAALAGKYGQEAVAWWEAGAAEMLEPEPVPE